MSGLIKKQLNHLLPILLCSTIVCVEITVEDHKTDSESPLRHIHKIRHTRDKTSPYVAASSTIRNPESQQLESFSLNCPHVADASNENVRIEVTWTLDDTIWLKLENGEKRIYNRLTSFNKRTINGKTVVRLSLNGGRYWFDYDELTGDFAMEIRPVDVEEDAGVWQCHVTVHQTGNTHTLTSRSRVKAPHQHRSHGTNLSVPQNSQSGYRQIPAFIDPPTKPTPVMKVFSRPDANSVHISRDSTKRRQTVVFDRQNGDANMGSINPRLTAIDYEMSMADEPIYTGRSRTRSAYYSNASYNAFSICITAIALIYL